MKRKVMLHILNMLTNKLNRLLKKLGKQQSKLFVRLIT